MTKPTMELVEEYGEACYEHGRLGVTYAGEDAYEKSDALLSEIRQRIEAMERDAAIGRHVVERGTWHRFSDGPDDKDAYSVAGIRLPYDALLDCAGMRRHAIDAAMAEGE